MILYRKASPVQTLSACAKKAGEQGLKLDRIPKGFQAAPHDQQLKPC